MAGQEQAILLQTLQDGQLVANTVNIRAADGKPGHDPRRFFESQLKPYAILGADGNASGLVTGYYEPRLTGSRTQTERFRYPLYAAPDGLLLAPDGSLSDALKGQP